MPESSSDNSPALSAVDVTARAVTTRRPRQVVARAWLWLALLWLAFELPTAVRSGTIDLGAVRASLDVLALLTLWGASFRLPLGRALRIALGACAVLLLVYRIDQLIFTLIMREEPLLYDQWFMLRHLLVLISDLMSLGALFAVGGAVVAIGLLVLLVRHGLRRARVLLEPSHRAATGKVVALLWAVGLVAALVPMSEPPARFLSATIAGNVQRSLATYRSIQGGLAASPYAGYAKLALADKPDVLLFIVESYGRILATDPGMRRPHAALLGELERELGEAGWHMASAFSRSSVSGGRSWIAEGTMVMGTPIRYEAVFHHLISHVRTTPTLVSFLAGQGYETVLLAPADRDRHGLKLENRYGFDQILHHETLRYPGPPVGWGIVPDAFSLDVARQRVLDRPTRPVFFDFHMVTSHAPWVAPPGVGGAPEAPRPESVARESEEREKSPTTLALRQFKFYERKAEGNYTYTSPLLASKRHDYQVTIAYDLKLIGDYLRGRARDALVIVLGDHQPPVITDARESFDCPVHVLSRDPRRLVELKRLGFVDGLAIPDDAKAAIAHAGLFSSVVRALASTSYEPSALPPVLREGFSLVP